MAAIGMERTEIDGLGFHSSPARGDDDEPGSVSLPTTHITHLVFHDDEDSRNTHFGAHLGFADRLTFVGPPSRTIHGSFVDCRKHSPTRHKRVELTYTPSLD